MPQAIVKISKVANKALNIIKARYDLRTKSEAINLLAERWNALILEPEIRQSYIKKLKRIQKQKHIKIGTIKDFRRRYGLE